jgi:hypothetical protein
MLRTARFLVFLCAVSFLLTAGLMAGLQPDERGPVWVCLAAALALFLADLAMKPRGGRTTVTVGGANGLRVGDTVLSDGHNHEILKIDGSTITWRRL